MSMIFVHDLSMYYEQHGERGPHVLLIHGLGSSARDWEHQVAALATRYRVLAVDLRAHGRTSRRGPITMAGFARDLAALLRHLEIDRAYVVGISLGGGIAFQLALDHPELVAGLLIVNSGPEGPRSSDAAHRDMIAWRIDSVRRHGMRAFGGQLADRLFPGDHQTDLRDLFVERWGENDPDLYLEAFAALVDWSVRDRLGSIAVPCALITGDRDYTPVELKRAYAAELRDAEVVVIERSGHMTTHDQPRALNAALLGFLDRWNGDALTSAPVARGTAGPEGVGSRRVADR
jgi:pimeloyl-ACP methyl ester carboxylesterase